MIIIQKLYIPQIHATNAIFWKILWLTDYRQAVNFHMMNSINSSPILNLCTLTSFYPFSWHLNRYVITQLRIICTHFNEIEIIWELQSWERHGANETNRILKNCVEIQILRFRVNSNFNFSFFSYIMSFNCIFLHKTSSKSEKVR